MRPMMSDHEITLVNNLLDRLHPEDCLEWGAGGSTVYFPEYHRGIKNWVAVEHDQGWIDKIKPFVQPTVKIIQARLENYLSVVKDQKFDFILIDGLMRAECLTFASDLLKPHGVILLHDSGRMEYQKLIREWSGNSEKLSDGEERVVSYAHRGLHVFTLPIKS